MEPSNVDDFLETNILGHILDNVERLYKFDGVETKHFSDVLNRQIFSTIQQLESTRNFSMTNLMHAFSVEERRYIIEVMEDGWIPGIDCLGASKLLIELWENREASDYLKKLVASLDAEKQSAREIFDVIGQQRITHTDIKESASWLNDCMLEAAQEIENWTENSTIKTGLSWLDEITNGFCAADLVVIGGLTGKGKTALATTIAYNIAHRRKPVLFFSMEMKKSQLAFRIISRLRKKATSIRLVNENTNKEALSVQVRSLAESHAPEKVPLMIDDTPNIKFSTMRQRALRFQKQYGLDCMIIDFLTLMQIEGTAAKEGRVQELDKLVYSLKGLAKELNIVIIVLCQLSREAEKLVTTGRGNTAVSKLPTPKVDHIRETGGIGFAADFILFVHDPSEQDSDAVQAVRKIELIVAKNRFGGIGKSEFMFNGPLTLVENL